VREATYRNFADDKSSLPPHGGILDPILALNSDEPFRGCFCKRKVNHEEEILVSGGHCFAEFHLQRQVDRQQVVGLVARPRLLVVHAS